jgi:hypothetical protein
VSTTFAGSSTRFVPTQVCLGVRFALQTAVAELCEVCRRQHLHKFLLALILLSVLASTGTMAHSGTDQEEKACAPDVQRFCRSDRSYDFGQPQGKSSKAFFRMPLRAGQPRGMAASARSNDIGASRVHIMDDVAGKIIKRSVES